jgi:hypothetical protein
MLILFQSCTNNYRKDNHIATFEIDEGVYNEKFQVFSGGVFAGDSYSQYITDSISFRKYIGTIYHDDEKMYCEMLSTDIVKVYSVRLPFLDNPGDTFDIKYYSLFELQKEGRFD